MKETFEWPEADKERLTRTELHSMQWFAHAVSSICQASDDLDRRLDFVPAGRQRMHMLAGQARSLYYAIRGTVPMRQRRQIQYADIDLEARLVPKLTPQKVTVTLDKETAMELVDAAQIKCTDCIKEEDEARQCKLCKVLEAVVPLENYESILCPYALAEWEDKP